MSSKTLAKLLSVAALVAAAIVMVVPTTAGADPGGGATVVKLGCGFTSPTTGKSYNDGSGMILTSPGGKTKATCTGASLYGDQTPVTEMTRTSYTWGGLDCEAVETTDGQARFSCHGDAL
jgi:hypothetical protein